MNVLEVGGWRHSFVPGGPYRTDGGLAWIAKLPLPSLLFNVPGDTRKNSRQSDLVLADAAGALGPAHAAVDDIRHLGGGRYAHWKDHLIFSTRDGKDPNATSDGLTATVTLRPQTWLLVLSDLLGAAALLVLAGRGGCISWLERVPLVGWLPRQIRTACGRLGDRMKAVSGCTYRRLFAAINLALAAAFLVVALFAIVSRYDLIKVTERIDFAATPPSLGAGNEFLVPRNSLYMPFVEIAPIETKPMTIMIDGDAHPCLASVSDVSALGQGRCSYANGYVYVSAPDNATIMSDGRRYVERFPIRAHSYVIYVALGLAALFALASRYATSRRRWLILISVAVVIIGAMLTAANIVGMNRSLRSPELAAMGGFGADGTKMTDDEALRQLRWRSDDTPLTFSSRATVVISQTVSYDYLNHDFDDLHVHIPIWENWILQVMGLVEPDLRDYTFWNPTKALERGVGLCGHVAAMLATFLSQQGIDARVVGLTGHIVVTAEVSPGQWYVLDPYNGIVIPHDMATLEKDGQMVRDYYRPVIKAQGSDPDSGLGKGLLDLYVDLYSTADDNRIYARSDADIDSAYATRERWTYRLKWPIPLLLLALGAIGLMTGYRREQRLAR